MQDSGSQVEVKGKVVSELETNRVLEEPGWAGQGRDEGGGEHCLILYILLETCCASGGGAAGLSSRRGRPMGRLVWGSGLPLTHLSGPPRPPIYPGIVGRAQPSLIRPSASARFCSQSSPSERPAQPESVSAVLLVRGTVRGRVASGGTHPERRVVCPQA